MSPSPRNVAHAITLGFSLALLAAPAPARAADADVLAVGSPAPPVIVKAHDGRDVELAKLKGKYAVVYFYPRDDTPGCTIEAKGFRDNWDALKKAGIEVFGVSTDGNQSHGAFATKYELPFSLLPDEKGDIAASFKVPVIGNSARRITYLIGPDGKVAHVWPAVKPDGHAQEILQKVAELGPPPAAKPATKTKAPAKRRAVKSASGAGDAQK